MNIQACHFAEWYAERNAAMERGLSGAQAAQCADEHLCLRYPDIYGDWYSVA